MLLRLTWSRISEGAAGNPDRCSVPAIKGDASLCLKLKSLDSKPPNLLNNLFKGRALTQNTTMKRTREAAPVTCSSFLILQQ